MTAPSFFVSQNLCAVVSAKGALYAVSDLFSITCFFHTRKLSLQIRRGLTHYAAVSFVFLGMICGDREHYDLAFRVGRLAVAIGDRFGDVGYRGKVNFIFGAHLNWLKVKRMNNSLFFFSSLL
jgi:hypothetical protein